MAQNLISLAVRLGFLAILIQNLKATPTSQVEECATCIPKCDEFKPCVLCQMYNTSNPYDKQTCIEKCVNFTPIGVEIVIANEEDNEVLCSGYDEDDCKYVFKYKELPEDDSSALYTVTAEYERNCTAS